jgi:hypothetical protein
LPNSFFRNRLAFAGTPLLILGPCTFAEASRARQQH